MANKKVSQLVSKPSVLVTDLFPIADPTTGQLFKTTISDLGTAIGSGVSSVNSLVGAVVLDTDDIQELVSPTNKWFTDTRARAALSASSPLAYNSGTGVFSIPAATSSQDGYLTSADWTTFNAKQAALSGTGFVKISGTTISYDNSTYLTTSAAASTYLALAGGTLTGALNGTSATFSGDLTLSSTNPRLYFTDTDNNPDYFISNTDGTFTVYDVTNSTSRLTLTNLYTTLNNTVKIEGDILLNQDSSIGPVAGYTTIASDASGIFLRLGTASSHAYLVLSGLTNYRNFTFPDATGTLALTSDLSAYLPLTGGVLSGSIRSTGYYLTGMTSGSGALYYSSGANRVTVANYNASGIVTFEVNGGSTALTLNSNLSATFASTLSATGATLTGALSGTSATFSDSANTILTLNSTNANGYTATQINYSGAAKALIGFGTYLTTDGGVAIRTAASTPFTIAIGGGTPTMTLATTGAATFSSSVTANSTNGVAGVFKSDTFFGSIDLENTGGTATGKWNVQAVSGAQIGGSAGSSFGIYSYGASAYRMFINSSGNVGIGTTSPSVALHVLSPNSSNHPFIVAASSSTTLYTSYRYNSTTDVGYIGNGPGLVTGGSSNDFGIRAENNLIFAISNTERMRIDSSGQTFTISAGTALSAGVTASAGTSTAIYVGRYGGTAGSFNSGTVSYVVWSNGNVVNTNNSYGAYSDIKLKENITDATSKLTDLLKVKIRNYNLIGDDKKQLGVIAQELEQVFPNMVEEVKELNSDETVKSVKYSVFVPMLIKAVQELSDKITTLENK